jgi:hypothetical protein
MRQLVEISMVKNLITQFLFKVKETFFNSCEIIYFTFTVVIVFYSIKHYLILPVDCAGHVSNILDIIILQKTYNYDLPLLLLKLLELTKNELYMSDIIYKKTLDLALEQVQVQIFKEDPLNFARIMRESYVTFNNIVEMSNKKTQIIVFSVCATLLIVGKIIVQSIIQK